MNQRGFCGCCSLGSGAFFTGLLATVYNGALIYWFYQTMKTLHSNNDFYLVLTLLLEVLMALAGVHIAISILLIYGVIKKKPDLVMLWVVVYTASCCVVASLFTIGLAFILNQTFLFVVLFNVLFVLNTVMAFRLYNEMIKSSNRESA